MSGVATAVIGGAVIGAGASIYASSKASSSAKSAARTQAESALEVARLNSAAAERAAASAEAAAAKQAEAARYAADKQLEYQMAGLNYLIKTERMPIKYRDKALKSLGNLYGIQDSDPQSVIDSPLNKALMIDQAETIETAKDSPLYAALMGTRAAGEEAVMRQAGATGGLRSGNVQEALYDYNVQLGQQSLLSAYDKTYAEELQNNANLLTVVSGIQGLSNIKTNSPAVAQMYSAIGQGQAQGINTAAAAEAQGANAAAQYQLAGTQALGQGQLSASQALAQGQLASSQAWQTGIGQVGNIIGTGIGQYLQYAGGTGANTNQSTALLGLGKYQQQAYV